MLGLQEYLKVAEADSVGLGRIRRGLGQSLGAVCLKQRGCGGHGCGCGVEGAACRVGLRRHAFTCAVQKSTKPSRRTASTTRAPPPSGTPCTFTIPTQTSHIANTPSLRDALYICHPYPNEPHCNARPPTSAVCRAHLCPELQAAPPPSQRRPLPAGRVQQHLRAVAGSPGEDRGRPLGVGRRAASWAGGQGGAGGAAAGRGEGAPHVDARV